MSYQAIGKMNDFISNLDANLAQWKEEHNGKIIGCFPIYCPEEILHAAGMLPVGLWGEERSIIEANTLLETFACTIVRSNLEMALTGHLDFLDGVVFPSTCDTVQCMAGIWRRKFPSMFNSYLAYPANRTSSAAQEYVFHVLSVFRKEIEELAGKKISESQLLKSIQIFNEHKRLMNSLYSIRREKPGIIRQTDFNSILKAAVLMPKEVHINLLQELVREITRTGERSISQGPKIVLSGHLITDELASIVDELGFLVVDDDFARGSRLFRSTLVSEGEPITELGRRYLGMGPCSTLHDDRAYRGEYLAKMVKESSADGVVLFLLKFCEPEVFDYPWIKKDLHRNQITSIMLEFDQESASGGQIRTRLQAFKELLA